MDKLEKFIFSKKYLPSILYFGSLLVIIIDIYCNEFTSYEFMPSYLEMLFFWLVFLYNWYIYKKLKQKEKMKQKITIFGIIVQIAGLIYGIVNKANDIVLFSLIFMFISTVSVFDKNENSKP